MAGYALLPRWQSHSARTIQSSGPQFAYLPTPHVVGTNDTDFDVVIRLLFANIRAGNSPGPDKLSGEVDLPTPRLAGTQKY